MRRVFSQSASIAAGRISIKDKKQIHHIRKVLRFKPGREIEVFDERGRLYRGLIEKASAEEVVVKVSSVGKCAGGHKAVAITVACALPKKSKMEEIVDKLTQLGVARIIPLQTKRVVVRLDEHKKNLRLARWKKIALNTLEQCRGCALPVIEPPRGIKEVLSEAGNYDLKLIPALVGQRRALSAVLDCGCPSKIIVLIGPEGDFTEEEVGLAVRAGFIPVSLGERVLRVETAAVAVVSIIQYAFSWPRDEDN